MYGSGEEELSTRQLAENLHMDDCVIFHGNVSNSEVLAAMRASDIFLFTSDRHEGWGAVANESMSQGCALVASDAIGSTPYLVKDRETGCIFQSGNLQSLFSCVKWLLDNPEKMRTIQKNALKHMQDVWSPANAAKSLLRLINNLQNGRDTDIAVYNIDFIYGPGCICPRNQGIRAGGSQSFSICGQNDITIVKRQLSKFRI